MSLQLSDTEKAELRGALSSHVFRKALDEALCVVFRKKRGAETLEAAAMAYNHQSGAMDVLDELFSLAEIKEDLSIKPRKLKHTTL
jgi:hypothetical protein